jgi:DNA-binding XRE family transcriptional regulator
MVNGRRKMMRVHRWAWEQAYGPIPPDVNVLHYCDQPPCFYVGHLRLGSQLDNMQDRRLKGHYSLGVRVDGAALRAARLSARMSMADLARIAGITSSHLGHIERGRSNPSAEVAMAFARALDVDLSVLLRPLTGVQR